MVNQDLVEVLSAVLKPTNSDVLFGRGRGIMMHPGNLHFHEIVDENRERYQDAKKLAKMQITKETIEIIRSSGGRFLTRNPENKMYEEADEQCIRDKVSHLFRGKSSRMVARKRKQEGHALAEGHLPSSTSTESLLQLQKEIFQSLLNADASMKQLKSNNNMNTTNNNSGDPLTVERNQHGEDHENQQVNQPIDIPTRDMYTPNEKDLVHRNKLIRHVSLELLEDDGGDLFQIGFHELQEDKLILSLEQK
eukprot:CAMPEP_0195303236 /NCGR_PEP_ID=MMETSP0707-20130614/32455_1 /TAXON_ID=33640 /ORGANISM="Asterionellopsis glacialis, Strain CCMP134" /LENGTH=249 /DNA_ID=CAMNT_0040366723 /DNA_START=29 /DNA_END=775 /DNA_ORIENTATION=+